MSIKVWGYVTYFVYVVATREVGTFTCTGCR